MLIVSSKFEEAKTPIQRHRMVNNVLKEELTQGGGPVHALSITAKTPAQWQALQLEGKGKMQARPKCTGGDGSLPKRTPGDS